MTTLIIQSDSEEKTHLMMQLAEKLGLPAKTHEFNELDINAMATGIGRKATGEELLNYLIKDIDAEAISLEKTFSKYSDK